mmetsp:Transcript_5490/g.12129  ORF Transcript_5490/g.12129 Transcript_5490/m.12129 type:complete len:208 (+) Transcript_5490:52-675(+)
MRDRSHQTTVAASRTGLVLGPTTVVTSTATGGKGVPCPDFAADMATACCCSVCPHAPGPCDGIFPMQGPEPAGHCAAVAFITGEAPVLAFAGDRWTAVAACGEVPAGRCHVAGVMSLRTPSTLLLALWAQTLGAPGVDPSTTRRPMASAPTAEPEDDKLAVGALLCGVADAVWLRAGAAAQACLCAGFRGDPGPIEVDCPCAARPTL